MLPTAPAQLRLVKNLILHYAEYIGLKVNNNKLVLVPINTPENWLPGLLAILGCQQGSFPFTYLGLPMSNTQLKLEDFHPIIQRIERRLAGCSTMLSYDGRLLMIKFVFSALPILVSLINSIST